MDEFEYKNLLERKKMTLQQIEEYYLLLRKYEYQNGIPLKNMEIRKMIHPILLELIIIDRKLTKEELYVIQDKRVKSTSPKIYACTHIGGNDVQRTFEAIKEHAYLFIGDLRGLYQDFTGKLLDLNGAICLETNDELDRKIAYERALEVVSNQMNLLIYPEGAWNITENFLVLPIYKGTVRLAAQTGADIIPVAIEQYENQFFVNIGENIKYHPEQSKNINEMNHKLRNTLAALKWEIWLKRGIYERKTISQEVKDNFQTDIINRCPYGFTVEDVYKTMYHDETSEYIASQLKISKVITRID